MHDHVSKYDEKSDNVLDQTYSRNVGEVDNYDPAHDAVFGDIGEGGPNYRNVCHDYHLIPLPVH